MSNLERDLRGSLRRRDPPDGFAERVFARVRNSERAPERSRSWFSHSRVLAVAAMVLVLITGFLLYREQQRASREQAREQLLYALRVTGSQVRYIQQRLSQVEQRRINLPVKPEQEQEKK